MQIFLFSSFKIPSDSMEPELETGDNILVCKPIVGARLFNVFASMRGEQTDIYRVPGIRRIKRNDVLVFNFPHPDNWDNIEMHILKYYVKRWGLLPEEYIVGKAWLIWKSVDPYTDKINWDRFLKVIH